MPSEADTALRPWLLGLGTLALAGSGLLAGILHLPAPWPGVLGTLLATGLLLMLGIMAAGAWVGTPFRLATLAEGWLLRWTARFAADPGAFLYGWAEAAPDIDRARERLQGAADRGHLAALRDLGRDYLEGAMGSTVRAAGLPWLQRAADRGDPESAYWLGEALRWGIAPARHPDEALRRYLQAARGGYRPAALWLARAFACGDGVAVDEAEALRWSQRAAALSGPESPGPGLPQRLADRGGRIAAVAGEFRQAADQIEGILWPQRWVRVGVWSITVLMLLLGVLVVLVLPPLRTIAILCAIWLACAAGLLRMYGLGTRKAGRGTVRLQDRARSGDPGACLELGRRFESGDPDLPRDPAEARRWYRRAADAGDLEAAVRLADLLAWGVGGPKDVAEARHLLTRAAALGLQEAHTRLGRMEAGLSEAAGPADEAGGGDRR